MKRVLILGCGGAGKSTLARRLGRLTALPVIHLDAHYWNRGWVATEPERWRERVKELAAGEAWIMDGNFASTFDIRIPRADTIIFLDLPRRVCLRSVLVRLICNLGRTRPDMAPGCKESIDREFVKWIWQFRTKVRPAILQTLQRCRDDGQQVQHFQSRAQVARFVASITPSEILEPARPVV
jgi:adenylate kinase family enzyme